MSPLATSILEEGVYIDNFLLVERGRFRERELYDLLASGPYPARNPLQNVNDLKAQIAANEKGVRELKRMVETFSLRDGRGLYGPRAGQRRRKRAARHRPARRRRGVLASPTRARSSRSGSASTKQKREATVDFTGTSPQQPDEFQRARAGDARRGALCVSRDGRRRHPDERRLPEADPRHPARRLDAVAALSGRGGGGQCRSVAGGDRHAVRRASERSARRRAR